MSKHNQRRDDLVLLGIATFTVVFVIIAVVLCLGADLPPGM